MHRPDFFQGLASYGRHFFRAKMPDTVGSFTIPPEWKRKHAEAEAFFKKPKAV
jgi:hypothetical protein